MYKPCAFAFYWRVASVKFGKLRRFEAARMAASYCASRRLIRFHCFYFRRRDSDPVPVNELRIEVHRKRDRSAVRRGGK